MNPKQICYGCFTEKEPGVRCPHCGFNEYEEQPYLALPLGTIVNGRYLVGKVLGSGGFGITYLGFDLTLEIKVAIKEYMPSGLATRHSDHYLVQLTSKSYEDFSYGMDRFLEEARMLAKLQDTPHIVSVLNYFKENNTAYFVMEYIEGMSLKEHLSKRGEKIPLTEALGILLPVMEALCQVHAMNLLHRDISPDNIYITAKGESRLLDFGAARFALGDDKSVSIILKHGFAPEEQYSSRGNQGPWTDVYAMGATLYRSITGVMPPDSLERLHGDTLKTPTELTIQIPGKIEGAILKALALKTENRYPTMEAFIAALGGKPQGLEHAGRQAKSAKGRFHQRAGQETSAGAASHRADSRMITYFGAIPLRLKVAAAAMLLLALSALILPRLLAKDSKGNTDSGNQTIAQGTVPLTTSLTTPATLPGTGPATEPGTIPQTIPAALIDRDLGILNASIAIPEDYEDLSDQTFFFANLERNTSVEIEFYWLFSNPIYTLSDVEKNAESILSLHATLNDLSDPRILGAGSTLVGGNAAYQILFTAVDNTNVPWELTITAVEAQMDFGSYFIFSQVPADSPLAMAEAMSVIESFQVTGPLDISMSLSSDIYAGIKFLSDSTLSLGGVWTWTEENNDGTSAYSLVVYPTLENKDLLMDPTKDNAGGIQAMKASRFGSTPREVLDNVVNQNPDFSPLQRNTSVQGNVEWLIQDFSSGVYLFHYSAAIIDDEVYLVRVMYDDAIEDAALALWTQIMATLRPL